MPIFFPRIQEFSPIFRLAEEIDRASRQYDHCSPAHRRSFAPRFDVKETDETYELYGELPGIDQSNVNIEWTDDTTLSISGNTSRQNAPESESLSISGNTSRQNAPESESTEVKDATPAASEEGEEWTDVKESAQNYQKPSVEEDGAENNNKASDAVATSEPEKTVAQTAAPKNRYWVSERSYGKFNRTFKFSARVEHDAVKASLKNGVLNVVVTKAKPLKLRKVTIN